jgi:quercetin dioxygenase-like cupin family protein
VTGAAFAWYRAAGRMPMQLQTWNDVALEVLSDTIKRRALHGEQATVARFELAKGAVVPRHSHSNEQYSFVLEGALMLRFDDGEVVLRPGKMIVIPPNAPHEAVALEACVVMDFFSPRREDWIRREDDYLRR